MHKNIGHFIGFSDGKRKLELVILILLIVLTSCVEVLSISAVLPFLSVLFSDGSKYEYYQLLNYFPHFAIHGHFREIVILGFLIFTVLAGLLRVVVLRMSFRLSFKIAAEISLKIYEQSIRQPYDAYVATTSSHLISTIIAKVNTVVYSFVMQVINLIASTIISVSILGLLFYISLPITCLVLGSFFILYYPILSFTKKNIARDSSDLSKLSNDVVEFIQETHGAYREILINGNRDAFIEKFKCIDNPLRNLQGKIVFLSTYPRYIVEMLGMIIIILLSYYYVESGTNFIEILPILAAVAIASQRLLPLFQQAYSAWANMQMSKVVFLEVLELLTKQQDDSNNALSERIDFKRSIKFHNVFYKYPGAKEFSLKNISFEINAGDKVGIVGDTGSGKTTLIDLMMGLLEPTSGEIYIDDVILNTKKIKSWRSNIALVPQSIFLFNKSVRENIILTNPNPNPNPNTNISEEIARALEISHLEDVVSKLYCGLEFVVGERGVRLSGGEKQRIGIARAVFKNSNFVIMDEGTSAMDIGTESKIISALIKDATKYDGKTILMIAHRLETLKYCNKILELKGGCLKKITNSIESLCDGS